MASGRLRSLAAAPPPLSPPLPPSEGEDDPPPYRPPTPPKLGTDPEPVPVCPPMKRTRIVDACGGVHWAWEIDWASMGVPPGSGVTIPAGCTNPGYPVIPPGCQ